MPLLSDMKFSGRQKTYLLESFRKVSAIPARNVHKTSPAGVRFLVASNDFALNANEIFSNF